MKILICLVLITSTLQGLEYEKPHSNEGKERLCISVHPLHALVNPISGEFIEEECDFEVAGCFPLRATRFYHHQAIPSYLYACWQFNPETFVKANFEKREFAHNVLICDEGGGCTLLEGAAEDGTYFFDPQKQKGVTNTGRGMISGQTHPKNIKVSYWKLFDPRNSNRFQFRGTITDGSGKRAEFHTVMHSWHKPVKKKDLKFGPEYWTPYYLMIDKVFLPNGLVLEYNYVTFIDDNIHPTHYRIKAIKVKNKKNTEELGSLEFSYPTKNGDCTEHINILGSDGRKFTSDVTYREVVKNHYYFYKPNGEYVDMGVESKGFLFLTHAKTPTKQSIDYVYDENFLLTQKILPDQRLLSIEYENARVKTQYAPVGCKDEICKIADYQYFDDHTDVIDAEGNLTRYFFDKNKLITAVQKYQEKDLYCVERSEWDETGQLKSQCIEDGKGTVFRKVSFDYDKRDNVLEETISGIGCEAQLITRTYSDDGFNLKLSESHCKDRITCYTYVPGTNLLASEIFYEKIKS